MDNQKLENLLNISLSVSEEERQKSLALETGYNSVDKTWELIVKHNGNIKELEKKYTGITVVELINEYAIITTPQSLVQAIANEVMVEYVEKPKRFYFELYSAKSDACINSVQQGQNNPYELFGENVIVAIIDTGIDITSSQFRHKDGTTRILNIWDQTLGMEYSKAQIDEALSMSTAVERKKKVPSVDIQGHGSYVAQIACGNDGVASKSDIIVVKMGLASEESFPRTTQLMTAVDYVVRKANEYKKPVAINLSFGNNYGNHTGTSLIETFLNDIGNYWKSVICIGTGNESSEATHTSGVVTDDQEFEVELAISSYELSINVQVWKDYWDTMDIELITPSGRSLGVIRQDNKVNRLYTNTTKILVFYGEPSPYSMRQEIYFDFIPVNEYIESGIWKIRLIPRKIVTGKFDMWLPAIGSINEGTGFLRPNSEHTFTIPSTALGAISVGAYDSRNNSYATFSGRGYVATIGGTTVAKPDIVAPGVDILVEGVSGNKTNVTGTSFATPFVTGAAALLMEWGIARGNDPFLYGEKVKAYLISGARKLPGFTEWPNPELGWGTLCVRDSLPL